MENIPKLGLWTWKLNNIYQNIIDALSIWYRHIDSAWIYNNEKEIWKGINDFKIEREKLWITSKVWFDFVPDYHEHRFSESDFHYTKLEERFYQSLKDLRVGYVDLLLLHRPTNPDNDSYAFEKLLQFKKKWYVRNVWVSNFPLKNLRILVSRFWEDIYLNQIEKHPCLSNPELENYMSKNSILLEWYSPLWHGYLLKNDEIKQIAEKKWITAAQLCIAYLLSKWYIVIPKSSSKERLQENFNAGNIPLDNETIKQLDSLPKNYRYNNPPFAPSRDS